MSKQPNFKQAALDYASKGWHVFPIKPGAKKPALVPWSKEATTDPTIIELWWDEWPTANIGIACKPSDLLCVDADEKNGKHGIADWAELLQETGDETPETLTQTTPSGGKQFIFRADGVSYQSPTGDSDKGIKPGIDIRAAGADPEKAGHIFLAPPSRVGTGSYSWDSKAEPVSLPAGVAAILPKTGDEVSAADKPLEVSDPEAYLGKTLKKMLVDAIILDPLAIARNETLNQMAYKLGRLYHLGGVDDVEILAALKQLAIEWHQTPKPGDSPDELAHAFGTIETAFAKGQENPREAIPYKSRLDLTKPPAKEQQEGHELPETDTYPLKSWADALVPVPPPDYILDELVEKGRLDIYYGSEGSLKTMMLVDMGICVAGGVTWLGKAGMGRRFKVAKPRKVLWFDQDSGAAAIANRVAALTKGHGLQASDNFSWTSYPEPMLDLADETCLKKLINTVRKHQAEWAIFDNLISVSGGANENQSNEMYAVLYGMRLIAEQTGAAVTVIHHPNKGKDWLRGSTAIAGAIDNSFYIDRSAGADTVTVTHIKKRFAPVSPFGAEFTYKHRNGTRQLEAAKFIPTLPTGTSLGKVDLGLLVLDELVRKPEHLGKNQKYWIGLLKDEADIGSDSAKAVMKAAVQKRILVQVPGSGNETIYELSEARQLAFELESTSEA